MHNIQIHKNTRKSDIADAIIQELKKKGWRKLDLAMKLNRTPAEISKWVSGKQNFTIDTLVEIETCLGVEIFKQKIYCNPCTSIYKINHQKKQILCNSSPKFA